GAGVGLATAVAVRAATTVTVALRLATAVAVRCGTAVAAAEVAVATAWAKRSARTFSRKIVPPLNSASSTSVRIILINARSGPPRRGAFGANKRSQSLGLILLGTCAPRQIV